jgi:sodium/bile acid cotransporter 7
MLTKGHLDSGLTTGLLFVSLLPSTVQSSIAFTSIARGNVPAALCCASVSNLAGVVVAP